MRLGKGDNAAVSRGSRNRPRCTMNFFLRRAIPLSTKRRRTVLCLRNRSIPLMEILQFPFRTLSANSTIPSTRSLSEFSIMAFRSRGEEDLSFVGGDNSTFPFHSELERKPPSLLKGIYEFGIEDGRPYLVRDLVTVNHAGFA